MAKLILALALAAQALVPTRTALKSTNVRANARSEMTMAADGGVVLIGVAADSGCGKSTFMRRLTGIFGGTNVGPLGGGFDDLAGGFQGVPKANLERHLEELYGYITSQEVASEIEALAQTIHDRVSNGKKPAKRLGALLNSYGAFFKVDGQQRPAKLALSVLLHRRQKGLTAVLVQPE